MDKDLQETIRTILSKLEDTDPKTSEKMVYIKILEDEEEPECAFHFVAKNCPEISNHPIIRALIKYKWKKWAFRRYFFNTILYFLSFTALTICSVVGAQSGDVFRYDSPWQYTRATLEIVVCCFILKALLIEVLQFKSDPLEYVKSIMNWVELSSALLLSITIALRYANKNAQWFTFAFGYVLWTIKGLKYAAVTSHTAAYAETLRAIMIRDFWLFALFFIAIEMVFGGTFLLVLKGTDSLELDPETSSIMGVYYVGLRTMIEGAMPIDYIKYPKIAQFVVIVFMSLTIVIMLNILIAQLSNTYEKAYAEGKIKSWSSLAEAIAKFEKKIFLFFDKKRSSNRILKLPFNKDDYLEEKEKMEEMRLTLKQLDGKMMHTELTLHTIKTRLNVLLHTVQENDVGAKGQGPSGGENVLAKSKIDGLSREVGDIKQQQGVIVNEIVEIKSLLKDLVPQK